MAPEPLDLDLELRRHGIALRQLAGELVRDPGLADDALQETWLHAARRPPRDAAPVGGWLVTILRRVVARSRRADRQRFAREQASARPLVVPDHAEVAARTELAQRLLVAVRGLAAPQAEAIWQRYFEGLPPRAIAARTGASVATVKSRLQRGLQQLRERLGAEGEADWRAAFACAFGWETNAAAEATGTTVGWHGGWAMAATKATKVAALALVAGIAAVICWPDRSAPLALPAGTGAAPPSAAAAAPDEPGAVVAGGRDLLAVAAEAAPTPPAPLPAPARRRGRVVDDETGAPLAGVTVAQGRGMMVQPQPDAAVVVTGVDGRFEFEFAGGTSPRQWFWGPGHVRIWRDGAPVGAGQSDDIGDVRLRRGRILAGRVTDERGLPLPAGTIVEARYRTEVSRSGSDPGSVQARTAAEGTFTFATPVPFGGADLELPGPEWELAAPNRFEVARDGSMAIELTARPRTAVRGVVVDVAGTPLPGIGLARLPSSPEAVTDDEGRFVLRRSTRGSPTCTVRVVDAPDFVPPPPREVAWHTHDLRLVLAPASVLPLEVVDETGAAVADFGVVLQREGLRGAGGDGVRQLGAHAGGRLDVTGIVPGATLLRVVPSDRALAASAWLPITDVAPRRLELARRLRVVVAVTCGGRPVAGAKVRIVLQVAAVVGVAARAPAERILTALANRVAEVVDAGVTAVDGTVSLWCDREPQGRWLVVERDDSPPHALQDFGLPPEARLQIELPGTGAIAGRVDRRGASRERIGLRLRAAGQPDQQLGTEPDGTFRSRPLAAGTWEVELLTRGPIPGSRRQVDVRDGETTQLDYDLADFPPAAVLGRLGRPGGLPAGLRVEFLCLSAWERPQSLAIVPVAADGAFGAEDLLPGTYRLAVRADGESSGTPPAPTFVPGLVADTFELALGERRHVEVPFPPRRLVVRLQRADGGSTRQVRVVARCGDAQWPPLALSAPTFDDLIVLDPAPALPIEFRLADGGWSAPVVMPPDLAEAEVTVVLPAAGR
ncbi:MAG: sigma-70 family RNA polymerase sigma factor [Planctomycetes bacterium]|nr:sigma-70 family RNA polymerase sigma factor [Planctomycetota bacterium]